MFAERSQDDEPLIDQIGDRVCDAEVALVLGVVRSHNRQNTRLTTTSADIVGLSLPP
jgi:hypothetical protein